MGAGGGIVRCSSLRPRSFAWVFALFLVASCGPSGGGGGGDGGAGGDGGPQFTLEIEPAGAVLVVKNGAPVSQPFTATARLPDGSSADVTASTTWHVADTTLGAMTGATLVAPGPRGGATMVHASYQGATAAVPVTIKVSNVTVVPPAPGNAADLFAAASEDPGRAPTIVYPSDQTMVPPNLGEFDTHFADGAGNDLFEVSLTSPFVDVRMYVTAAGSGWVVFPPDAWRIAGETERGRGLKVTVRGLATGSPGLAGSSPPLAVRVAKDDVEGGIYYWAASASGIYRHDFGKPGVPAEPYYTPAQSGGRCVACHALSRDGTRMAVTFDGGNGGATVLDVASRAPLFNPDGSVLRSNFTVFDPSGTRMLTTFQGTITLRDPATAGVITTVPAGAYATHPDWSPRGDLICWIAVASPSADWYFGGGRLMIQPYDAASDTFGAPVELVPQGPQNIFYPTFSPDGEWILYNQSSEDAYDDATAEIWAVPVDGSRPPLKVSAANVGPGLTNSWARWAPFPQQTGGEMNEPFYWFTVSSKRAFGVRLGQGVPQIWMAPFFPMRAAAGQDPSLPAFRLPFQDLHTSNHIAQWTETVVPIE